jgi:hypothetical protein
MFRGRQILGDRGSPRVMLTEEVGDALGIDFDLAGWCSEAMFVGIVVEVGEVGQNIWDIVG